MNNNKYQYQNNDDNNQQKSADSKAQQTLDSHGLQCPTNIRQTATDYNAQQISNRQPLTTMPNKYQTDSH